MEEIDSDFEEDLIRLINSYGVDAYCSVPDYILASFVVSVLHNQKDLMKAYDDNLG